MSEELFSLMNFKGTARLFPLPNVVLFPNVMLPLHIFEQRYRQMTADALADDRLIAMVLLRQGWEENYEGKPPVCSIACLGRIVAEQALEDGRYNLMLRGLKRARVLSEIDDGKLYRTAEIQLIEDREIEDEATSLRHREELTEVVQAWLPHLGEAREQFNKLLHGDMALGMLIDILSFALPIQLQVKQMLLEEARVEERVSRLNIFLKNNPPFEEPKSKLPFPPPFSAN